MLIAAAALRGASRRCLRYAPLQSPTVGAAKVSEAYGTGQDRALCGPGWPGFDRKKTVHPAGVLSTLDKPSTDVGHDVIRQQPAQ
jgi:hypothetical protein